MKKNIYVILFTLLFIVSGIGAVYAVEDTSVKSSVKTVEKTAECCCGDSPDCKDKCTCADCKGDGKCEAECGCCCKDGEKSCAANENCGKNCTQKADCGQQKKGCGTADKKGCGR